MKTSRRSFVKGSLIAGLGVVASSFVPLISEPVGASGPSPVSVEMDQDELAGGYIRPYGRNVCLPPQEWFTHGDWVMWKTLELLQPDRWHSWGDWPEHGYPGRIPMVFATRYFDQDRVLRRMQARSGEFWANVNEPEMPNQCFEPAEAIAELTCKLIDLGQRSGSNWQWGSPAITLSTEYNGLAWLTQWLEIMRQKKGIAKPFTWFIHPYTSNTVQRFHDSMGAWWEWYHKPGNGQGAPTVIHEVCAEDADEDTHADVMLECDKLLRSGKIKASFERALDWGPANVSEFAELHV